MFFTLIQNTSSTAFSVSIKPDEYITNTWIGNWKDAFVGGDTKPLETLMRKEIINKLNEKAGGSNTCTNKTNSPNDQQQTDDGKRGKSSLFEEMFIPPQRPIFADPTQRNPYNDPLFPRIGGGDLDPLHRSGRGGGMLYDPFRPDGGPPLRVPQGDPFYAPLPPGAVPPGARYDPIGPPIGRGKTRFPDPDHLPPPGGPSPFL